MSKRLISGIIISVITIGVGISTFLLTQRTNFSPKAADEAIQMDFFIPSSVPGASVAKVKSGDSGTRQDQGQVSCGGVLKGNKEPFIIWSFRPLKNQVATKQEKIRIWYNDEYPITLGKGQITPWDSSSYAQNPDVGDESARDKDNLPYYPALFIIDTTKVADPVAVQIPLDHPYKLDEIYGTWKALGYQDRKSLGAPPANKFNLPPGADPFPDEHIRYENLSTAQSRKAQTSQGYGALVVWDIEKLGLKPGHTYKAQAVLHDGDSTGDVGVVCVLLKG